jgi:DNA invertase Pin-like site-specific DNA recombinase
MTLREYIKYLRGRPQDALVPIGAVVRKLAALEPEATAQRVKAYYRHKPKAHPKAGEIMRLRAGGMIAREIAGRVGISASYVQRIIQAEKETQ